MSPCGACRAPGPRRRVLEGHAAEARARSVRSLGGGGWRVSPGLRPREQTRDSTSAAAAILVVHLGRRPSLVALGREKAPSLCGKRVAPRIWRVALRRSGCASPSLRAGVPIRVDVWRRAEQQSGCVASLFGRASAFRARARRGRLQYSSRSTRGSSSSKSAGGLPSMSVSRIARSRFLRLRFGRSIAS